MNFFTTEAGEGRKPPFPIIFNPSVFMPTLEQSERNYTRARHSSTSPHYEKHRFIFQQKFSSLLNQRELPMIAMLFFTKNTNSLKNAHRIIMLENQINIFRYSKPQPLLTLICPMTGNCH
jgi:hypothetical protein